MTDTQFVSDKPITFNCDLDLDCGSLNFVGNTSHLALPFCEVKFPLLVFELWLTHNL